MLRAAEMAVDGIISDDTKLLVNTLSHLAIGSSAGSELPQLPKLP
jgi:hypothetical protein